MNKIFNKTTTKKRPYFCIREYKRMLANTDYLAIKYAEGLLSADEYAPIKAQRQMWRDEINAIQAQLTNK